MRVEYAQYNVAVTLVCPGPVFSNVATEAFTGDVNKVRRVITNALYEHGYLGGDLIGHACLCDIYTAVWLRLISQKHAETQPANANYMMTERCSELMATAIANRCGEVWISTHPVLLFTYLAQYTPALFRT